MRKGIHPEYYSTTIQCSGCGNSFTTGATVAELRVTICNNCHPFYTGTQKIVDSLGRVGKFNKKYGNSSLISPSTKATQSANTRPTINK